MQTLRLVELMLLLAAILVSTVALVHASFPLDEGKILAVPLFIVWANLPFLLLLRLNLHEKEITPVLAWLRMLTSVGLFGWMVPTYWTISYYPSSSTASLALLFVPLIGTGVVIALFLVSALYMGGSHLLGKQIRRRDSD